MSGVSVEAAAVAGAISLCQQSIQQFNKASNDLNKKYAAYAASGIGIFVGVRSV